jgi:hypothetical protein
MIEEGLVQRLLADTSIAAMLVGQTNRIYPLVMPQRVEGDPPNIPCIVYRRSGSSRDTTFCATDNLVSATFQLDSYAANYTHARQLARLVRRRLVDFTGTLTDTDATQVDSIFLSTEFDLDDPDPGLYRVSQTFNVWYREV